MSSLRTRRFKWIASLSLLAAAPGGAAQPQAADRLRADLLLLQSEDARVAQVGWRLATANRMLCSNLAPRPGVVLYDLAQFGPAYRAAADRLFGVSAGIAVGVVVPGSAAARAGIVAGDIVRSIDGRALIAQRPGVQPSFVGVQRAIDLLDERLGDGSASVELLRGDTGHTARIAGEQGCASLIQIVPSERRNASADGRTVTITTAAAEFARSPDELAALVAHELAHNILKHRVRLNAAGVSRGLSKGFGKSGRLTRAAEDEADRLSIHLMARAGYDPALALAFWERFGRATQAIINDGTHAHWRDRTEAMQREIAGLARVDGARCPPGFDFPAGACQPPPVDRNQRSVPSSPTAVSRPEA